ncbi:MAG: PAS-domain containing protein, partial [Pseudolabrys sp.]|nr:PAS-domain containing protein [Pseudolabrys sp.]
MKSGNTQGLPGQTRLSACDPAADRERLSAAINNITQGVCFFDGQHRLIICNDRYLEMYGINPGDAGPGTTLAEIVSLREAAGFGATMSSREYLAWRTKVATGPEPSDTVVQLMNGRSYRIKHQPMADGGWVATHEDITDAQNREAAIRMLFEANPIPMWVFDRQTLKFLAVNDVAVRHYGWPRERFLQMTLLDLRPKEEWEEVRRLATSNEQTRDAMRWRHFRADGTALYVETYGRSLSYEGR